MIYWDHLISMILMLEWWCCGFLLTKILQRSPVVECFPLDRTFCLAALYRKFTFADTMWRCQFPFMMLDKEDWQLKMAPFINCTLFPFIVRWKKLQDVFNYFSATNLQSFTQLIFAVSRNIRFALFNDRKWWERFLLSIETSGKYNKLISCLSSFCEITCI